MARPYEWTEERIEYLRKHSGFMPVRKIASTLGKSYSGVAKMAKQLNLPTAPTGCPPNLERDAWLERFAIGPRGKRHDRMMMSDEEMEQLSLCRSDEARRLLLGISEQFDGTRGYKCPPPRPVRNPRGAWVRKRKPVEPVRISVQAIMYLAKVAAKGAR